MAFLFKNVEVEGGRILHGYSNYIVFSPGEARGRILHGYSNPIVFSLGEAGGRIPATPQPPQTPGAPGRLK